MADFCKLCERKLGFFASKYLVNNENLCEDCYYAHKKVKDCILALDIEAFETNLDEFKNKFSQKENVEMYVDHLNSIRDSKLPEIEKQLQEIEKQKEEKLERERIQREIKEKYGTDYYMQCDLCKHIFHYTEEDVYNDIKAEYAAAKRQLWGGVNMIVGNAYMGQSAVYNAEEKSSRIVDRSKCPKCGNSKLNRLTEAEAKSEMENQNKPVQIVATTSAADELKKFKELLDIGAITQEEFDAKKKQLLDL